MSALQNAATVKWRADTRVRPYIIRLALVCLFTVNSSLVCCKPVCPAKCGNGKMKGGHTGPPLHYPPRPSSACLLVCSSACLLVCLFACLLVCLSLVCLSLVCLSLVCLSLVCLSAVNLFAVNHTIKGDLSHRERPPFGRYLIMCWLSGCYRAVKIACLDAISR